MYLKELTINGFKSFARKSEFEFSTSIAAIVGPNGSGKSNVAESFRFVLGEQSVKSLRGKKGEDLIWGGSEQVSRGNRASVEVVFDNTGRAFALDFDEIKIERIVHRDGQNEYKINGSVVRLKDVHELLAGAHIGATGHHIISQGEADRVLSAGAKERREMIEDALGLKVFQLKKQEAEKKLKKTHDNIAQVESLRREAAPHLKYLKKQVEKAERAIAVQQELKQKYAEYLKREDVSIAYRQDNLQAARREPAGLLTELEDKLTRAKETIAEFDAEVDGTPLQDAQARHQQARATLQAASRTLSQLEGQVQFLKDRLAAPVKKIQAAALIPRKEVESLAAELEELIDQTEKSDDVSKLQHALRDIAKALKHFLHKEQGEVIDTTAADKEELAALEEKLQDANIEVEAARAAEAKAAEKLTIAQDVRNNSSEQARLAERELFDLMNQRRDVESQLRKIDAELLVLERDRADFKQELQEAVALLGRAATDYFSYQIVDGGASVADNVIGEEDRTAQRERRRELEKLKIRLEELGVGATEDLIKEYEDAKARDEFLEKELGDLGQSVGNLTKLITEMNEQLHEQFTAGVDRITTEFNTFFSLMFGGGSARLERVKLKVRSEDVEEGEEVEEDATAEGVELNVQLPNKRVKGLEMLSGGERALTSIALIFAMSQVNPPPFIILDETDAALDEANSRRYGDMIEALAKKSQLVLITHNRETMSRAGILYGITMGSDGVSKVLSVKFDEAVAVAK